MGLILDTSAVIGWVELQSQSLLTYLDEAAGGEVPVIHAVTLGELARGVQQTEEPAVGRIRMATLAFARDELEVVALDPKGRQPALFGLLASSLSRKVSHNDCWIAAAAMECGGTLVTQDEGLAKRLDTERRHTGSPIAHWLAGHAPDFGIVYCPR